jgi:hypothetical protein
MAQNPRPPLTLAGLGDRTKRRGQRRGHRRVWVFDNLRMPRVWMTGPKWRRYFGVRDACHRIQRMSMLIYSFEDDVRELVLGPLEIRPGVYAQWVDPWEILR